MSESKIKKILAYTDGSAVIVGPKKGNGGFGTYFPDFFGKKKAFSMGFLDAKTGQMEVTALLMAINAMPKTCISPIELIVYSDSEYVVKSFTEGRLLKWEANGWKNSSGVVKNRELWELILSGLQNRKYLKLTIHHIRSHQVEKEKDKHKKELLMKDPNIIGNLMADRLADYKRHEKLHESIYKILNIKQK